VFRLKPESVFRLNQNGCSGWGRIGVHDGPEYARSISVALPLAKSIDNYIDSQWGDEKIAFCRKLGIVKKILEAEKSSFLHTDFHNPEYKYALDKNK